MFYQPKQKTFAAAATDTTDKNELVIGVAINGEAKAYPIQIIGYHHQVTDTIGRTPVMITYCTVCRTGRVYSPFVNGKKESFRLVGMDHFNAMFEDAATGSWWQQATGKVVAGPLKGTVLKELVSKQLTLAAWLREYPNSHVMQPDPSFKKDGRYQRKRVLIRRRWRQLSKPGRIPYGLNLLQRGPGDRYQGKIA